jgi:hypothetical protein
MRHYRLGPLTIVFITFCMAMLVVASPPVYGQAGGTSSTLSGLVVDGSGGVIPGATVVVKNNATAGISQAVTDGGGGFTIPALQPGTYTVTVTLQGFKTFSAPDVKLVAATPARIKAVLEVGNIEETVVVHGATELVQTQTAAVQTTIVVQQIQQLPLVTHTALDYVVNLPGVSMGVNGGSRASTINGLNNANINITLDGVNVQDNNNRNGDGFFMYIRPMMDSVEEITVSSSTPEAASAAQGAQQIRMVTRSGSNRFSGSAYNTWRNQAGTNDTDVLARTKHPSWLWGLNTPYWFNKRDRPKTAAGDYFIDDVRLQTPGFRVGGPILKDKLFYFFNSEWFLLPQTVARTRTILTTNAQAGQFSYPAADGSGVKSVNLYSIAGGSADPTIAKLLADIRAAASSVGSIDANDENTQVFNFNPAATQKRVFPTLRVDYNLTNAHRLTFSSRYNMFRSSPDFLNGAEAQFPGFPAHGAQDSDRFMWQASMRSTFGKNVVNEARVGWQGAFGKGTTWFNDMSAAGSFGCSEPGCQSVKGQPFFFDISTAASGITNAATIYSNSARLAPGWVYEDSVTWLKGKHTISAGASYSRFWLTQRYDVFVPTLGFAPTSLEAGPYNALGADSGNFPGGIDDTFADYARNLYWVLTGRVTQYGNTNNTGVVAYLDPVTGKYTFPGTGGSDPAMTEWGFYISDQWRLKPNLTLNAGLRYEMQPPFTTNGSNFARLQDWRMVYGVTGAGSGSIGQGNMFQPGTLTGTAPILEAYPKGDPGWNTDWNNFAPSIGLAWRPSIKQGFLSKILSTEPVLRGGYSISYGRQALASFTGVYGNNPGRQMNVYRTDSAGDPVMGYDGWPVSLQQVNRLVPANFPDAPTYPVTPKTNDSIWTAYPDLKVPYTHQWSAGFQREVGKGMAIELRYVGNRNVGTWQNWNLNNNVNFAMLSNENGFYDEFRKAQANLRANIIAGKGNTFAYTGATGTSPLPIYMAYFQGYPLTDSRNQNPANYTNSKFKSSSWYNQLSMYNPAIGTAVGSGSSGLRGSALAANAVAAGLPANFFVVNPSNYQTSSNLLVNGGVESFHGLQFEWRRRMAQGLMVQFAYQTALSQKGYNWRSLRESPLAIDATRTPAHGVKFNWIFELPFGQGKPFGSNVSRWANMAIGGWEIDGVLKWNTGTRFNYGNFRLVGMSEKEFQDMFKFYHVTDETDGKDRVYMLPQDVIANSILAISKVSATTATGYSGAAPQGKYLAPASGPDCVQYLPGQCPGTALARIITGPSWAKLDMAFVKRFGVGRNMHIEARMDLYNITDAINFNATAATGANVRDWQVTGAYADFNANQDAGGRTTQFSLRFTW